MRRHLLALVAVAWAAAACTKINPNYCADAGEKNGYACSKLDASSDAPTADAPDAKDVADALHGGDGPFDATEVPAERPTCTNDGCSTAGAPICDVDAGMCVACATDDECAKKSSQTPACGDDGQCYACTTDTQCSNATMPICDGHACRACDVDADCASKTATPTCAPSGKCVECAASSDCAGTKPVCNLTTNTCRACQTDAECSADPGVCMADGHCAGTSEVIFVEYNSSGCVGADGTSAKPYCAPNDGVAQLGMGHNVIVLLGSAGDRMTLNTIGISPVIIGRKNANVDGSVPATAAAAVTVMSDTVLIRDLTVNVGTTPTSKGIAVAGASTKVSLLRVTASLGTGLGLDAESGASLTMDECYVLNNSAGGILINGASYSIQNTVIAGNGGTTGYGVQFSSAVQTNSQFWFNTVVNNPIAMIGDLSSPEPATASIVVGLLVNCTLSNSSATGPTTFSATPPYHLTGHFACPLSPAMFPSHDIDGDPRATPIDCGADQFQ